MTPTKHLSVLALKLYFFLTRLQRFKWYLIYLYFSRSVKPCLCVLARVWCFRKQWESTLERNQTYINQTYWYLLQISGIYVANCFSSCFAGAFKEQVRFLFIKKAFQPNIRSLPGQGIHFIWCLQSGDSQLTTCCACASPVQQSKAVLGAVKWVAVIPRGDAALVPGLC